MRYRDIEKSSGSKFYWLVHVEVLEWVTRTKRSPTSETGAGDSTPPVQSAAAPFLARGYPGHAGAADGRRCRLRLCLHADWALGLARLLAGRPSNCTTTRRKCVPTLLTDLNSKVTIAQ